MMAAVIFAALLAVPLITKAKSRPMERKASMVGREA